MYILDNELGGAMFWDMSTDDFNNQCGDGKYPLIGSVNNVLNDGCQIKSTDSKTFYCIIITIILVQNKDQN